MRSSRWTTVRAAASAPEPDSISGRLSGGAGRRQIGRAERLDRPLQALVEAGLGLEADQLPRPADVEVALWLPIRAGVVPDRLALEPGERGDRLRQLADAGLPAGADIDGIRDLEALGAEHQRP